MTKIPAPLFAEDELPRYARHIALREIGGPGQARLKRARVLVVGAGGLGSPVLMYLAAAGVGRLTIVDDDLVSRSNLQRQVVHAEDRVGLAKVNSARIGLAGLNPYVAVEPVPQRLDAGSAARLVTGHDLAIDACDNLETRHVLNAACIAQGVPLLSGAISQWEGQVTLYDPARGAPCFACLFPVIPAPGLAPDCAEAGVMGALPAFWARSWRRRRSRRLQAPGVVCGVGCISTMRSGVRAARSRCAGTPIARSAGQFTERQDDADAFR